MWYETCGLESFVGRHYQQLEIWRLIPISLNIFSGARRLVLFVSLYVHLYICAMNGLRYGSRAVELLLYRFYNGEIIDFISIKRCCRRFKRFREGWWLIRTLIARMKVRAQAQRSKGIQGEKLVPRKQLPPLLLPLPHWCKITKIRLDWIGTSAGLTLGLVHRFWRRTGMRMRMLCKLYRRLSTPISNSRVFKYIDYL